METTFLQNFMRLALRVTQAERALVVDANRQTLETLNLERTVLDSSRFQDMLNRVVDHAITQREAFITNNIIADPEDAPKTNTSFSDLRVVVAFPVGGLGAVYLDQLIRRGVIERDVLERLARFASDLIQANTLSDDVDTLYTAYQAQP